MSEIPSSLPPPSLSQVHPQTRRDDALHDAARKLEASFISEMLKSAGLGKPRDSMGGGAGEEQFASFLREAQAKAMVDAGGIGLSEILFNALKETSNDN